MAFTKLNEDLDIIVKLDDEPNDVGGFSADELKAKFDEAGNLIKEYLNSVLLVELEQDGASNIGVQNVEGLVATTLKGAFEEIIQAMADITQGSVADGSITSAKLANNAVETAKISDGNVTSAKIADYAITAGKIGSLAVTSEKIANKAIGTEKLNDYAVTAIKIGTGSVTEEKLANSAVANSKIADSAVGTSKIADNSVTGVKLAANAVSSVYTATLNTTWSGWSAPYSKAQTISGILASDNPIIDLIPSDTYATAQQQEEAWAKVYRVVASANTLTFYAREKPAVSLPIKVQCIRK